MQTAMASAIIAAVITGAVWLELAAAEILWMRTAMVSVIIMEPAREADMAAAVRADVETASLDNVMEQSAELPPDYRDVWEAVFSLPQKYRDVVYLHYFEDYTAPQISHILGKNVNTIYTLLTRSKQMLKEKLGGAYEYE